MGSLWATPKTKNNFFFQKQQNQILSFQKLFLLTKYHMFWLSYECFSILCNAFLLKSAISSHNSCDLEFNWIEKVQFLFFLSLMQAWRGRKKAGVWSPLALFYPRWVVSYRWSKNNILASLCLASYLAANWLQKLETKHCAYYAEVISVSMCV